MTRSEKWRIAITAIVVLILASIFGPRFVEKPDSGPQTEIQPTAIWQAIAQNEQKGNTDPSRQEQEKPEWSDQQMLEMIQQKRDEQKKSLPKEGSSPTRRAA